jgi:hypothetical protein
MLWRVTEPKREEMSGGWRKMHNEELHNLYASPNIIRVIWAGYVVCMGHEKSTQNFDW